MNRKSITPELARLALANIDARAAWEVASEVLWEAGVAFAAGAAGSPEPAALRRAILDLDRAALERIAEGSDE